MKSSLVRLCVLALLGLFVLAGSACDTAPSAPASQTDSHVSGQLPDDVCASVSEGLNDGALVVVDTELPGVGKVRAAVLQNFARAKLTDNLLLCT